MAFSMSSSTRPGLEPLDGETNFQRLFHAYVSEFDEKNDGDSHMEAELTKLVELMEALKQEKFVAPRMLQSMIEYFVKRRFGLQKNHPDVRDVLKYTTYLVMWAFSKRVKNDDADGLATLYEYMIDTFYSDGTSQWREPCPHGSVLYSFALFLRRIERTQDEFHNATVAILKSRQVDAVEFEVDDAMSDVILEKGRHLGGLVYFSSFLPLDTSTIFNLNAPEWLTSTNPTIPSLQRYSAAKNRIHLLQEAGFSFFSGFVDEFGLIDIQVSDNELLAVVDILSALVAGHPVLCAASFQEIMRLTEPLTLLFPWRFLPLIRLFTSLCFVDTANSVFEQLQQSTYTHLSPSEAHYSSNGVTAVSCSQEFQYAQDRFVINTDTPGQSITIDDQSLICWHTGTYSLFDILLVRLQNTNLHDELSTAETTAILHLIAALGRYIPLSRFESTWRKILGTSNGIDGFSMIIAGILSHSNATLSLYIAAIHVIAILDGKYVAIHFDADTVLVPAMSSIVKSHDFPGVTACLECWLRLAPHTTLGPYVPLLLHLLHDETTQYEHGTVTGVRGYRLLTHCLTDISLYNQLAPTLLDHARSMLFSAACTLLGKKNVEASLAKPRTFDFNRQTKSPTPFLPHSFGKINQLDGVYVEAVLHTIHRLLMNPVADRKSLVTWLYQDKTTFEHVPALAPFVGYGEDPLNWPMACAAYITCPFSPSIRLLSIEILTVVALTLKESTLMACFRTPEDTQAFLKSLLKILRSKDETQRLQSAVWHFLTISLHAQPSVLSLLFEKDLEAPACLVDALHDSIEMNRWTTLAYACSFFGDIWNALSHSNAAHHMATLLREQPMLWPTLTQPLGTSLHDTSDPTEASFAQGSIFNVLSIEYHVQRQSSGVSSTFLDILRTFRDLYDRWFVDFTTLPLNEINPSSVPLPILSSTDNPAVYVLQQWTTFMEIYFLQPTKSSITDQASPSAARSRSRVTCDSPMLPTRTAPERPSTFTGDRTSLEWSLRLAESMVQEAGTGQFIYVQELSSLCLCMVHHQICEIVHKANDPRYSTTQLRSSQLDWDTSTHLLLLFQTIIYHIQGKNAVQYESTMGAHMWTATLILLRHISQLARQEFSSLLLSRLVSQSITALNEDKTFDVALMVLQEVLSQTRTPADPAMPTPPSTFQVLAIVSQSDLVKHLVHGWSNSNRRSKCLRCLLSLLSATSPHVIQSYVSKALIDEGFLDHGKVLARELTNKPTKSRDSDSQDAWCLLVQLMSTLIALDQAEPVLELIAYVDPVLHAVFYSNQVTEAILEERTEISQLILQTCNHMQMWQHIMPGTFSRLLESLRTHLVPCSFWLQDTSKWSKDIYPMLWKVVHVIVVVLNKLTPSTKPCIQVGDDILVDMEAARPILDYTPLSAAQASVPCGLGHLVRLLKCGLKPHDDAVQNISLPQNSIIDAMCMVLATNYVLHENRYDHPSNQRIEMHKSITEVLKLAKTGRYDAAFITALETLIQQIEVPQHMAQFLQRRVVAALPHTRLLLVEGNDAAKYLQGIFTNDVHALKIPGDVRYGAFLTHKGRMLGDANIIQNGLDSYFLSFDAAVEEDILKHLKKYKLRSKVNVTSVDDQFHVHSIIPSFEQGDLSLLHTWTKDQNSVLDGNGIVYIDPRHELFGARAILPTSSTVNAPSAEYELQSDETFTTDHRILLGATEGKELRDGIPLEYNFDLLQGVSMTKGCYVGQELISRTHYKGSIRKRIVPFILVPNDSAPLNHPFTYGDPSISFDWAIFLSSITKPIVAADSKIILADTGASVGKVVVSASNINAAVGMLRLEHLRKGKLTTEDGTHTVLPFAPTWWTQLNIETGKPASV